MAGNLGSLVVSLQAETARFESDLGRAARIAQRQSQQIAAGIAKTSAAIAAGDTARAGVVAVAVKSAINRQDQLSKAAQSTGIATARLSELAYAGDLADTSLEDLISSAAKLNRNAVEAANGTKAQAEAFAALGVSVKDANGFIRPTDQILSDVAERFSQLEDGARKSALAQEIFGKSGANLLPLLNGGAAGLREAAMEASAFGLVVSSEAGKAAEDFNDNLTRLEKIAQGAANTLAADLLPALVPVSNQLVELAKQSLNYETRNSIREFAESAAIGLARLAEVLIFLYKTARTVFSGLVAAFQGIRSVVLFPGLRASNAEKAEYAKVLKDREEAFRQANDRFVDLINYDGAAISTALQKSFAEQRAIQAAAVPKYNPLASLDALSQGPQIFRPVQAPLDYADQINTRLAKQNALKAAAPADYAGKVKAENAALEEQARRLEALAQLSAGFDRERLSRATSLTEAVLTQSEQFQRQIAEINALQRDGSLTRAAERFGLSESDLQNRLVIQAGASVAQATQEQEEMAKSSISSLVTFAEQGARNIQDSLAQFLFNPLNDGLSGFVRGFANTLRQIAAQAAASSILKGIFGGLSGSTNPFFAAIGGAFGGNRAYGGNLSPGRSYRVNERGPEVATIGNDSFLLPGTRSGRITPLAPSSASGSGVAIGDINIDARGAQDPAAILRAGAALEQRIYATVSKAMQRRIQPGN